MARSVAWGLGVACALVMGRPALAEVALPPPPIETGIADQAGLLSGDDVHWLSTWRSGLERRTGGHLAVLVVPDTGQEAPRALAARALEAWRLGPRSAVLLVVRSPRAVYLQSSADLGKVLDEPSSQELLERYVAPQLTSYPAGALYRGLEAVSARIERAPGSPRSLVARALSLLFTGVALAGWALLAFLVGRWTVRRARAFALRRSCGQCGARMGFHEELVIRPTHRARGHGLRLYSCPCGGSLAVQFEIPPLKGRREPVETAEVIVYPFGRVQQPRG